MKPKVLIAMHYLEIGGAETALVSLLRAWDVERADIDLFLYSHRGEMMRYIPAKVNLLPEKTAYRCLESPINDVFKSLRPDIVLARWIARKEYVKFFQANKYYTLDATQGYIGRRLSPLMPRMSRTKYDLAISFLAPHNYVLDHVKAKKKVCWIHTDYTKVSHDAELEHPVWAAYDNIVSLSPDVTKAFNKVHPGLEDKIVEIGNLLSKDIVIGRSEEFVPMEFSQANFNILTIGRFTEQKNIAAIPFIMKKLMECTGRDDLRWYIIGYGGFEWIIRQNIKKAGMEGKVIVLGKKENPYPYISKCDLYVQPSIYEGRSVTVREAQMLGRPVVVTAYPTAASQIEDGVDGVIVPMDSGKCAEGLSKVISDKALMSRLSANCVARDYSDIQEIEKVYSLIP